MLYQIEKDIDDKLAHKIGTASVVYTHWASEAVKEVLKNFSFKEHMKAMIELEEDVSGEKDYSSDLEGIVRSILTKVLSVSAFNRLEKAQIEFLEVKAKVLDEGYTQVNYTKEGHVYYSMVKPGEPTTFFESEYEAVMSVKPVESSVAKAPNLVELYETQVSTQQLAKAVGEALGE